MQNRNWRGISITLKRGTTVNALKLLNSSQLKTKNNYVRGYSSLLSHGLLIADKWK